MTSLLRGGHQKVTLGDKGGGGSQKSQNKGDVLYGQPLTNLISLISASQSIHQKKSVNKAGFYALEKLCKRQQDLESSSILKNFLGHNF